MTEVPVITNVPVIMCKRCGQEGEPHKTNAHLCETCVKAENNRISYYRAHNYNWLDVAKEAELEIWERQPGETDREYQVWLAYRDAYPGIKPSYRIVAEQLGTTLNVVKKVGQRWSFPARLQAWAKYCDSLTMAQRQKEIVDMNARHIRMANTISEKLEIAIDNINPMALKPKEIQGLFKMSVEIERKARLDDPDLLKPVIVDDQVKAKPTKTEDLAEVVDILTKAGLLSGVRQITETKQITEVVVHGEGCS